MSKPDFANGHRVILGGTVQWAQLTPTSGPNKFSEKYQVELILDEKSRKEIEDLKIADFVNIKTQEGETKYETLAVRLKSQKPPQIFDRNKAVFDDYINNGSKMRVQAFIKSWEMAGRKGLTCYINQGVVLEAAERQDGGPDDKLFEGLASSPQPASNPQPATGPTSPQQPVNTVDDDDLPF